MPDPKTPLHVLAVEPWLGGSHRVFLENFQEASEHRIELHGLPARHWKWRMRAGAWDLAKGLADHPRPDALFVSDYLDLPAFMGFLPASWAALPCLVYFHENQLTYPLQGASGELDTSYGFMNILSCVRADRVLFNSSFHRTEFATAAEKLLLQVPRHRPLEEFQGAMASSVIVAPGVRLGDIALGRGNTERPLRILFPHRWEHDKDPLAFLNALVKLREQTSKFELVLLGEQFDNMPAGVDETLQQLAGQVMHQGYLPDRKQYTDMLGQCDLVVSSARHEFFGMAIVEAMAAGVRPLLPNRLSYPEVLGEEFTATHLYENSKEFLAQLLELALDPSPCRAGEERARLRQRAQLWSHENTAKDLDRELRALVG
jgi:glycosyltransferase involved in cell wall biosynthesis